MLKLIPAIMSKDAEALSKAARTCVIMAIILVFCALFPWLLNLIGSIIYVIYGVLISSFSTTVLNIIMIFIHIYYLKKSE